MGSEIRKWIILSKTVFPGGTGGDCQTDYLAKDDWEIPDQLVPITFLGRVGTIIKY